MTGLVAFDYAELWIPILGESCGHKVGIYIVSEVGNIFKSIQIFLLKSKQPKVESHPNPLLVWMTLTVLICLSNLQFNVFSRESSIYTADALWRTNISTQFRSCHALAQSRELT